MRPRSRRRDGGPPRCWGPCVSSSLARPRSVRRRAESRCDPLAEGDVDAVVEAVNAFYAGYDLFPPQTRRRARRRDRPDHPRRAIPPIPRRGHRRRRDRRRGRGDGTVRPHDRPARRGSRGRSRCSSRVAPLIPRDGVIRSIELNLAWHAPGRLEAGHHLWDAIRFEWRDRATHVAGQADPRGSLIGDVPHRPDDDPADRPPDPRPQPDPPRRDATGLRLALNAIVPIVQRPLRANRAHGSAADRSG